MTTTPDLDTLHTYTRFASAIPPRCIYVNANGDGADPDAYGHHCPYGKWPMFLRFFFQCQRSLKTSQQRSNQNQPL